MSACVAGIGAAGAGDDAVGLVVVEGVRARLPGRAEVEIRSLTDPSDLVPLLDGSRRVVVVDALLAGAPGRVLALDVAELAAFPASPTTHGFGLLDAIALATSLADGRPPRVRIVAVTIGPPRRGALDLSPAVAGAVDAAVLTVLAELGANMHESSLARHILAVTLERAGGERIRRVRAFVREAEALSAESLALHFAACARGTPAEGALVEVRVERVSARCACGTTYEPEHHFLACPACGGTTAELLADAAVGVETIELA